MATSPVSPNYSQRQFSPAPDQYYSSSQQFASPTDNEAHEEPTFPRLPMGHTPAGSVHEGSVEYGYSTYNSSSAPTYPSQAGVPAADNEKQGPVSPQSLTRSRPEPRPGKVRQFFRAYKTVNQLVFLSLIVAQSIVVLVMVGLIYKTINDGIGDLSFSDTFDQAPKLESVATYMSLFILAVIFELLIALDALQEKNILTLVMLLFMQLAMVVYSSLLPSQLVTAVRGSNADVPFVRDHARAFSTVIPAVIAGFTIVMMWMIWRLYGEFGWNLYKSLGADLKIKRMYAQYQAFVCLLKFDCFVFVAFCVQFLVLVTGTPTAEFAITIAALPVILVVLALGAIFVRREIRWGTYIFMVFQLAGMAYFLYKLVRIWDADSRDRYAAARKTLTLFSVISLVFLVVTFIMTGLCLSNFGRGLRERMPKYRFAAARENENVPTSSGPGAPLGQAATRMSLD
ncbi:hypothetical protein OIO90_000290 [Microbotryomycetes sp. JL221]|nr:hypothetical protein OIO90_000290 [Microbotryomycetes sp. JL221]